MYCSRALDWRTLVCSVTLGLISSSLMLQVVSVDTEHFTMNTQQWTQNTEHRTPITQYWTSILKTAVNSRSDESRLITELGPVWGMKTSLEDDTQPSPDWLTDWWTIVGGEPDILVSFPPFMSQLYQIYFSSQRFTSCWGSFSLPLTEPLWHKRAVSNIWILTVVSVCLEVVRSVRINF